MKLATRGAGRAAKTVLPRPTVRVGRSGQTYSVAPPTLTPPPVTFNNDRLEVRFDRFDPAAYAMFLRCKKLPEYGIVFDPVAEAYTIDAPARFATLLGIDRPATRESHPLADHLFDDQALLCGQALDAKRFALWCQCGWGKTLVALEYGRQVTLRVVGGRVLIVTINEIVRQWIEEAAKWYGSALPLERLHSRSEMREWCKEGPPGLGITNYEKFNPDEGGQVVNECRHLAGVIVDENRLKGSGGKQKWALIKSFRGVEYKLTLTATPAPNDFIEYASQASFLEKMKTESDIIWTFFTRDGTLLAPAVNDYVLVFRKPGEHPTPPKPLYDKKRNPGGWVTTDEWVRYASGVWADILEIDVLDGSRFHKESKHEKHLCPLQLEVIRRCVRLYTNPIAIQPDVTVLDPFNGIGSTAYVCLGGKSPVTRLGVEEPRNVVGFELKESYYRASLDYAKKAGKDRAAAGVHLFAGDAGEQGKKRKKKAG